MHCVHNSLQGLQQLAHTLYITLASQAARPAFSVATLMAGTTLYIVHTYVSNYTCNESSEASMQAGALGKVLVCCI
jgi:Mn2+/Fe2+ NRAMP family transporter